MIKNIKIYRWLSGFLIGLAIGYFVYSYIFNYKTSKIMNDPISVDFKENIANAMVRTEGKDSEERLVLMYSYGFIDALKFIIKYEQKPD